MRRVLDECRRESSQPLPIYIIYIYLYIYMCVNCTNGFISVNGVSGSELRGRNPSCEQDPIVEFPWKFFSIGRLFYVKFELLVWGLLIS